MIDLPLYRDVLRRHRWLVTVGVAATLLLAVFSLVRVSPSGISYRSPQIWSNEATLILSQKGFSEGRSVIPQSAPAPEQRFATLVELYTELATSDAIVAALKRQGLLDSEDLKDGKLPIAATAVPTQVGGFPSPVMKITATGETPAEATKLTIGATDAFVKFLTARQAAARIPEAQRVQLRVVKRTAEAKIAEPRSKTPLIVVLLAGLTLTAAAAFVRDNMQRRTREGSGEEGSEGLVSGSAPGTSKIPTTGGLSLAPPSGRPFDAGGDPRRLGGSGHVQARLEALWPRLRAESIGLVHIRCYREGAERGIVAVACYAGLSQDRGSASVAPSTELVSELDEVAFALLVSEVGVWRDGDGLGTLVLDAVEKTATFHQGWFETNEANGRLGSRQSLGGRST